VRRMHHGTTVRAEAILAVLVRAADVDLIRMPSRRDDEVVIDALTRAVVECCVVRVRSIVTRQFLPRSSIVCPIEESARRLRGVIRSIECGAGRAVGAIARVNSRLSIRQMRGGKLCPIRARGAGRLKDLRKSGAAVSRPPDTPTEDARVN